MHKYNVIYILGAATFALFAAKISLATHYVFLIVLLFITHDFTVNIKFLLRCICKYSITDIKLISAWLRLLNLRMLSFHCCISIDGKIARVVGGWQDNI